MERERLGTTGVGHGIGIPHGKLPELDRLYGLFARLETPIAFDAIDDHPVHLHFVLLAPETAGADHLKALAPVPRLFRASPACHTLPVTYNAAAISALLPQTPAPPHPSPP